jgi:CrcB protein
MLAGTKRKDGNMGATGLAAVGGGAAMGAWLRWWLGAKLNPVYAAVPLGTLAANLLGGLLVGIALAWFERTPGLSPQLRLLVVTGFLGGLTTFSTFSAEVMQAIQRGAYGWAAATAAAHLFGSLLLTATGIALVAVASRS